MPWFHDFMRRLIRVGRLSIIDPAGRRHEYGPGGGPSVCIRISDRRTQWRLLLNPELYLGEAYMDGTLVVAEGSVQDLLALSAANAPARSRLPLERLRRGAGRVLRFLHQYNPLRRARANVAHHYDLSHELYERFLDRDLQYSCAYFGRGRDSLEQAQQRKKVHIAAKLLLKPGMRVLDIGCGWGGLDLYLAGSAGVDVTGITLSREQLQVARERIAAARLASCVRAELKDYREVAGSYDRIVSVGMFEHVGVDHYRAYFDKVRELLAPDGVALVHAIGRRSEPGTTNAWIRRYIFPGGYCPALSEVLAAVERADLWVTDVEILRLHYAYTLHEWSRRFARHRAELAELYDERFCRMWEFYLAASESAFRYDDLMVFQIQLARRRDAVPLTRDYMFEHERQRVGEASAAA